MADASAVKNRVSKRLHPAGRGDRARDQKQAGRIGQQAGVAERLPYAVEFWRRSIALAAEAKPGFLAGLADRGDRQRSRARRRRLRTAFHQIGFKFLRNRRRNRNAVIQLVDAAARKHEFAGHEHHLVVALADQDFWDCAGAIDQDQRRGIHRPAIGMMIGLFFFFDDACRFAHFAPHIFFSVIPGCALLGAGPESILTDGGYGFRARAQEGAPRNDGQLRFGIVLVKSVHAQRPLHADHRTLHRLQQHQRQDQRQRQIDR